MQQKASLVQTQEGIEQEVYRLTEELRTVNVSHENRLEFEAELERCIDQCHQSGGEASTLQSLYSELQELDEAIAFEALHQAESEISKREKTGSEYLGLENIRKELAKGTLSPTKARHEIKEITRHYYL